MVRPFHFPLAAILMAGLMSGCGRGTPQGQTEEQRVQDIVTSAPDLVIKPADVKNHFLQGCVPDRATLKKISVATLVAERPRITGDQATVAVSVRTQGELEIGKVEWTLVKEFDQWKIQSAPMP